MLVTFCSREQPGKINYFQALIKPLRAEGGFSSWVGRSTRRRVPSIRIKHVKANKHSWKGPYTLYTLTRFWPFPRSVNIRLWLAEHYKFCVRLRLVELSTCNQSCNYSIFSVIASSRLVHAITPLEENKSFLEKVQLGEVLCGIPEEDRLYPSFTNHNPPPASTYSQLQHSMETRFQNLPPRHIWSSSEDEEDEEDDELEEWWELISFESRPFLLLTAKLPKAYQPHVMVSNLSWYVLMLPSFSSFAAPLVCLKPVENPQFDGRIGVPLRSSKPPRLAARILRPNLKVVRRKQRMLQHQLGATTS